MACDRPTEGGCQLKDEAKKAVQAKVSELRRLLQDAEERRDAVEFRIDHYQKQIAEARRTHADTCAEEGSLRMQIGELTKALDAL